MRETVIENRLLDFACRVGRRFPSAIPTINRRISEAVTSSTKIDRSHNVYATRRDVKFTEMEYAIPREHGAEAVRRVLELIERRRLPIGFPIEVRVVAGDDAFLSTAQGRDTCYVAVHQYHGMEFESYLRAVEAIMDTYGGRPHWGKRHYQSAESLRPRYPELGPLAGGPRAPRPWRGLHQRLLAEGARARGGPGGARVAPRAICGRSGACGRP